MKTHSTRTACIVLTAAALAASVAVFAQTAAPPSASAPPLVAYYPMEPDAGNARKLVDSGALGQHGSLSGDAAYVDGKQGKALRSSGKGDSFGYVPNKGLIARMGDSLTISAWLRFDGTANGGFIAKRRDNVPTPWALSVGKNGELGWEGNNGQGWENAFSGPGAAPRGEWFHYAFTYRAGDEARHYVNGKVVASRKVSRALATNDQDLVFGRDPFRGTVYADFDEVRLYAAALTPEQVRQEMNGGLATRVATEKDFPAPTHPVAFALVRWDAPLGQRDGVGRTRRTVERRPGPDAVDWPSFTLDGRPLWETGPTESRDLILREGGEARPLFRQGYDSVVEPGGHWLRAVQWLWGQRYAYTTDATARTWHNDYELWAFPVKIQGAGEDDVRDVVLACGGRTIYRNAGPLRSLTLMLPQNEPGKPYELSVAGKGPVRFDAGLQAIAPGKPEWKQIVVDAAVPGTKIRIASVARPETFPYAREWEEDRAAMAAWAPAAVPAVERPAGLRRYLGVDVPRSPLTINALALPHGMSGAAFFSSSDHMRRFEGTERDFAAYAADTGYDRIFERAASRDLAAALAARGVRFGLIPDTAWRRPFLTHPNIAFFAHNLPDHHAPLYRELQLAAQKLNAIPGFAGVSIGADNGGYVSFWDWAPPIPNRPWGEAFVAFNGGVAPTGAGTDRTPAGIPLPKHMGGTATVREFVDYVARYDGTYEQYGYFADAVTGVDPRLVATTGSFGSSPGVGARGGWPWASLPGKPIYAGMPVQTAYDWNELSSSKPMHLPALIDRLKSYHRHKPTWAIVDDFKLFFGREARQRAYALALTRGVQAIGTTFLAAPTGPEARPQTVAEQKELYAWMHRYGGAYALTEPQPAVGILYVHPQALLRAVNQDGSAPDEALRRGSHEGKTTEALFLAHAAGWPARIVTPDELQRGDLPATMKALLLVGLNRFDESWAWHDGLEDELKRFVASGGRILLDDESVVPAGIAAVKTGMVVRAYHPQSERDSFPLLLGRNRDNIAALRRAMQGAAAPVAASADPTVWAVPTTAGDTQYVTVVNWGYEEGKNASQVVKPQTGTLAWRTDRPIYDVRLGRRITPQEAATVDFARDAFQYYALPPAEVTQPTVTVNRGADGFYEAAVLIKNPDPMAGIPIEITVASGGETATVYGATGQTVRLPLTDTEAAGATVAVKELLSGLTGATLSVTRPTATVVAGTALDTQRSVRAFLARKDVPLTIALTDAQARDPAVADLARRLQRHFAGAGRKATLGRAEPDGVVLSPQELAGPAKFPRWKTVASDLVLLGSPKDNPLLFDQTRGDLLPGDLASAGATKIVVTHSPFVGEFQCLNILGADTAAIAAGVAQIAGGGRGAQR